jgi:hypothetical protein
MYSNKRERGQKDINNRCNVYFNNNNNNNDDDNNNYDGSIISTKKIIKININSDNSNNHNSTPIIIHIFTDVLMGNVLFHIRNRHFQDIE